MLLWSVVVCCRSMVCWPAVAAGGEDAACRHHCEQRHVDAVEIARSLCGHMVRPFVAWRFRHGCCCASHQAAFVCYQIEPLSHLCD